MNLPSLATKGCDDTLPILDTLRPHTHPKRPKQAEVAADDWAVVKDKTSRVASPRAVGTPVYSLVHYGATPTVLLHPRQRLSACSSGRLAVGLVRASSRPLPVVPLLSATRT